MKEGRYFAAAIPLSGDQIRRRVGGIRVKPPGPIPMSGDQIRLRVRKIRVRLPGRNPNVRGSNKVKKLETQNQNN